MKNKKNSFLKSLISMVLVFYCLSCYGAEADKIKQINIDGNKLVSSTSLMQKIKAKVGDEFSQFTLSDDLKRLYQLGYFTDVQIETKKDEDGVVVTFIVKEKPLISSLSIKGSKNLSEKKIKEVIKTKEGELFDPAKINADMEEIKRFYQQKGFASAEVSYDSKVDVETHQTVLTFNIKEEVRTKIKKIDVKGNKALKASQILRAVKTKKSFFIIQQGYFKEDIFNDDILRIKAMYQNEGYADVEVTPEFNYSKDGRLMYITFNITEGKKYLVGVIFLEGNNTFPETKLRTKLRMNPETPYSGFKMRDDVFALKDFYQHYGYMAVKVDVRTMLNSETGKIDVYYGITENELTYVDKVKILGNTKTKDIVIRRELRLYPGDKFDGDKLSRSKERIYNLGFFEEVNFDTEPTEDPSKQNLVVSVKEGKTGEFSFGAGYSTVDQVIGFAEILQRNFDITNFPYFTGAGQQLRIRAEIGTIRKDYEVGWLDPWIFNMPYSFGFDVYQRTHSRKESVGYGFEEQRRGFDVKLGKALTDYTRADLIYKLEDVKLTDVPSDSVSDLKEEEGTNMLSTVTLILTHDTRDNVFNPKRGYLITSSIENAGGILEGDKDFIKSYSSVSVYFLHFNKMVLELKARVGLVDAYGDSSKVPVYERFYAGGGYTIRGYKERRIGPKDPNTGDPIGGESLFIANAEYTFPIFENLLKGAIFYDIGNVWEQIEDFGSGSLKSGVGIGVRVKTPIGPINLDYGYPLSKLDGERQDRGRFYFSISQGF